MFLGQSLEINLTSSTSLKSFMIEPLSTCFLLMFFEQNDTVFTTSFFLLKYHDQQVNPSLSEMGHYLFINYELFITHYLLLNLQKQAEGHTTTGLCACDLFTKTGKKKWECNFPPSLFAPYLTRRKDFPAFRIPVLSLVKLKTFAIIAVEALNCSLCFWFHQIPKALKGLIFPHLSVLCLGSYVTCWMGPRSCSVWLLDYHLLFAWMLLSSFIAFPPLSENL